MGPERGKRGEGRQTREEPRTKTGTKRAHGQVIKESKAGEG